MATLINCHVTSVRIRSVLSFAKSFFVAVRSLFEDHFYDDWPEYRQYLDHGCNYEEPDGALDTINPRIEAVESFVHVVLKTTERDLELVPCDQAVSVFDI